MPEMRTVIRDAVSTDIDQLGDAFRRSSLSNERDRANILANPEVLDFGPANRMHLDLE